jgi:hypothetical protein
MSDIHRRKDVNPKEGQPEYGHVEYADPVNKKYPVDAPEHVRAASSCIHHKDNRGEYSSEDAGKNEDRIKRAAKKHGVEISEKN